MCQAKSNGKIQFLFNTTVEEILGEQNVTSVKIKNDKTNEIKEMPVLGVFVAIGHIPNTKVFEGIELDGRGFIKVHDHYQTNVEGVFVAGDVHDAQYKQAITAAGFGCAAALEVEKWLSGQSQQQR